MSKSSLLLALVAVVCTFVAAQIVGAQMAPSAPTSKPGVEHGSAAGDPTKKGATEAKETEKKEAMEKKEAVGHREAAKEVEKTVSLEKSSDIIGKSVVDTGNQNLGKVSDLIFDKNGRVSFVIIGFGGMLGIGEKYVAIPWNLFASAGMLREDKSGNLMVNVTKEKFEQAPSFAKDQMPDFAKGDYRDKVISHFGAPGVEKGYAETP